MSLENTLTLQDGTDVIQLTYDVDLAENRFEAGPSGCKSDSSESSDSATTDTTDAYPTESTLANPDDTSYPTISPELSASSNFSSSLPESTPESPVVPHTTLTVSLQILLNGHPLSTETDAAQSIYRQFQNSPLWSRLFFSASVRISSPLQLFLHCDLFNPLLPELALSRRVRQLKNIRLALNYCSPHHTVPYANLARSAQYLLTSLVLNLEYKYPFVFSYYGKHVTSINFHNMVKNNLSFATPLGEEISAPHGEIVDLVLAKLHGAILSEFNTVNVMKECDLHPHRARSCKERGLSAARQANRSVKARAVDLRLLGETPE